MSGAVELISGEISRRLPGAKRLIVAIDGPCGSGKSSCAGNIAAHFGGNVFHMDDFFLRPEQRTPERYAEPGGNVDRERFLAEVLEPLRRGEAVKLRRFDCSSMRLLEPEEIPCARVVIVEGSYSLHPELRGYYDLRVAFRLGREEQLRRLRRRGPGSFDEFLRRWIPLEDAYFDAAGVYGCADIVIDV